MRIPLLTVLLLALAAPGLTAQADSAATALPYYQIPDYPADYGPGNVLARAVDALGFRYHWATEGLRAEDLAYRPSPEARDCRETLVHLLNLAEMVRSAAVGEVFAAPAGGDSLSYPELRRATLERVREASAAFAGLPADSLAQRPITFGSGANAPVWNLINGPLADAIYHTGQIVTLRRASGNPMPRGVNVFRGKKE